PTPTGAPRRPRRATPAFASWSAAPGRRMRSARTDDMALRPAARKKRPVKAARTRARVVAKAAGLTVTEVAELDDLRRELERLKGSGPSRWTADQDEVQRLVAQLVL